MVIVPFIEQHKGEMRAIFEDLHAHPEIGFEEVRTSAIVATKLREFGFDEVHENIGKTGVVGILRGKGQGNRRIGLRADMDALPMEEHSGLAYASRHQGKMHACGHDGHTTMLLGAAQYLAATRDFDGMAVFIFQPAEEGLGGARQMIAEGLFEKFPCDEIYGMHNMPKSQLGVAAIRTGAAMAGASFFDIVIHGKGSHGAHPHESADPLVIGSALVQQFQTIVARNVNPTAAAVLSCTKFHSGTAYNIIPAEAEIGGTLRFFDLKVRDLIHERMIALCQGFEAAYNVKIDIEFRGIFDVLVNDAECASAYADVAEEILGAEKIERNGAAVMGSEDFADMLRHVPGAYIQIGHGSKEGVHHPAFALDPELLPIGSSLYARIIEKRLPLVA